MRRISFQMVFYFLLILATFPSCNNGSGDGEVVVELEAILSGDQGVPPVMTTATGTAIVTVNGTQTAIDFILNVSGITSTIAAAHIHLGELGENGAVLFTLTNQDFTDTLTGTLTEVDSGAPLTFDEAVNAILSGGTYLNVHTTDVPSGEIRGQIGP